ncbi:MAG TPA: outer membrane lipid asymmetry maintenance protein MlaD [Thermopetrobacter sp.]|nr:outer membrane lipid asymmetry maintenance protein MlaD [Thermopetrobacter sp.]
MNSSVVETIVGAIVIAIAAVFFFFVYSTTDMSRGRGGYQVNAVFDNIDGIAIGSDVRLAGIKVGSVVDEKLDQETYQAVLTLAIDSSVKLPEDTSAKVTSEGLLGDKYIALDPGGSEEMLKNGDYLSHTQSALDIWALVNKYIFDEKNKEKK